MFSHLIILRDLPLDFKTANPLVTFVTPVTTWSRFAKGPELRALHMQMP